MLAPDIAVLTDAQIATLSLEQHAYCETVPALVVEVKSPSDREIDIARKVAVYLSAGVQEVWWIRPLEGQMIVHRPDRAPEYLGGDHAFEGSDVLAGFSLSLRELLDPNPAAV